MTPDEQQVIFDLALNRISEEEFLRYFRIPRTKGSEFALTVLENAYREKSPIDVEAGLLVGFHFGFTPDHFDILRRLSHADWHQRHEDVVTALGELHDPRTTETLYQAALKTPGYLEYDDSRALAVKAIWALGRLQDSMADEKLRALAESGDPIVKEEAAKQLRRRGLDRSA